MTRHDLDAIRARWRKRGHSFDDKDEFERHARTDIPALLAYIDELERRLKEIGAQVDELREQYDSVLEANVQAMDGRPWRCCK